MKRLNLLEFSNVPWHATHIAEFSFPFIKIPNPLHLGPNVSMSAIAYFQQVNGWPLTCSYNFCDHHPATSAWRLINVFSEARKKGLGGLANIKNPVPLCRIFEAIYIGDFLHYTTVKRDIKKFLSFQDVNSVFQLVKQCDKNAMVQ